MASVGRGGGRGGAVERRAQTKYGGKSATSVPSAPTYAKEEVASAYDRAAREPGGGRSSLNYESIKAAEAAAAAAAQAEHTLVPSYRA
jgi:hypothetical protein